MIGNIFKLVRIANGLLVKKEVTVNSNVDDLTLRNLEEECSEPAFKTVVRLADFYNIPIDKIIEFDKKQQEGNLDYQQTLEMILHYYNENPDRKEGFQKRIGSKKN